MRAFRHLARRRHHRVSQLRVVRSPPLLRRLHLLHRLRHVLRLRPLRPAHPWRQWVPLLLQSLVQERLRLLACLLRLLWVLERLLLLGLGCWRIGEGMRKRRKRRSGLLMRMRGPLPHPHQPHQPVRLSLNPNRKKTRRMKKKLLRPRHHLRHLHRRRCLADLLPKKKKKWRKKKLLRLLPRRRLHHHRLRWLLLRRWLLLALRNLNLRLRLQVGTRVFVRGCCSSTRLTKITR